MAPHSSSGVPVLHILDAQGYPDHPDCDHTVGFEAMEREISSSSFEDLLRAHQEQLQSRLNVFLAREEQLARNIFERPLRHKPGSPFKGDSGWSNQSASTPRTLASGQSLFKRKEFLETDWRPRKELLETLAKGASPFDDCFQRTRSEAEVSKPKPLTSPPGRPRLVRSLTGSRLITKWHARALAMVRSSRFDALFLAIICINSVVIGMEVQCHMAGEVTKGEQLAFDVVQFFCSFVFLIELWLRLYSYRWNFFTNDQWCWNCFDLVLVSFSTIDMILHMIFAMLGKSFDGAASLSCARILRILRITRIARTVRFIRALRVLLLSIIDTLKTVVFALGLTLLIIYFMAVIVTQAVSIHIKNSDEPLADGLEKYWGNLFQSMLTLFYCISGGLDWCLAFEPLVSIHPMYGMLLIIYIIVIGFAIMSAITGAFCQAAANSRIQDKDHQLQDFLAVKRGHLHKLFEKMADHLDNYDGNNNEDVNQQFVATTQDPSVQTLLETLDLKPDDAWALFRILDEDGAGSLDMDRFLSVCMHMKGEARSIDVAKTTYDQKVMRKQNALFMRYVADQFEAVRVLMGAEPSRELHNLENGISDDTLTAYAEPMSPLSPLRRASRLARPPQTG
jgi:hypothetical protein